MFMIKFYRVDGNFTDKPLHRFRTFIFTFFKVLRRRMNIFGSQTGHWKEHTDHSHGNNKTNNE
jgi:hypothetical protein